MSSVSDFLLQKKPSLIANLQVSLQGMVHKETAMLHVVSHGEWIVLGALPLLLLFVGHRLHRFANPEMRYLSPVIRTLGHWCLYYPAAGFTGVAVVLVALTSLFALLSGGWDKYLGWIAPYVPYLAIGLAIGLVGTLVSVFGLIPRWERRITGMADTEKTLRATRRAKAYDPGRYFDLRRGLFSGRAEGKFPLYVPWNKVRETHIQIQGTTGSGKGIWLGLAAYQCILVGEGLVYFDPKPDRRLPGLIAAAAQQAGKLFYLLDLNPTAPPQFNLLAGCSEHEIEELLVAGFDLIPKGTDGDYHRGRDQDAAMLAARIAVTRSARSVPALLAACQEEPEVTGADHFWREFRKLAASPAINTEHGIDLARVIHEAGVLYVMGSSDSQRVKVLQKMVLVRLMQLIKQRNRDTETTPIAVVLDEFKHMASRTAFTSLGVVRDFNSHFFLAHQSLGDLDECPGVSREVAYGAVVDNTAIKVLYKINNAEHAERLAKVAGKVRSYRDITGKRGSGPHVAEGSWQEAEIYRISPDVIMNLPVPSDRPGQASAGILFGVGDACWFSVSPLRRAAQPPSVVPAPPYVQGSAGGPSLASELI